MDKADRDYVTRQMTLWPVSHEHIVIEFTVHFRGDVDELQLGWVMKDARSHAWIAAQVPQLNARLVDVFKLGEEVRQVCACALEIIDPFPAPLARP